MRPQRLRLCTTRLQDCSLRRFDITGFIPRPTASTGRDWLRSREVRHSARRRVHRSRRRMATHARFIAARLRSCRDETRCMSGTFRSPQASLSMAESGRASMAARRGMRFPIARLQTAATPTAAAWNKERTTWNCKPFRMVQARICTRVRSIYISVQSMRRIPRASPRRFSILRTSMDAILSPRRRMCIPISTRWPT
jgi:hypothetical protein